MKNDEAMDDRLARAARAIQSAEAILIGAGPGMGVDSGLPDFRGDQRLLEGVSALCQARSPVSRRWPTRGGSERPRAGMGLLWPSHDALPRNRTASRISHSASLDERDAQEAVSSTPRTWTATFRTPAFPQTRFTKSTEPSARCSACADCGEGIFPAETHSVIIDEQTMRAVPPLPRCPKCGGLARPNILMFGDWGWNPSRAEIQQRRLRSWLASLAGAPLVVDRMRRGDGRFPPCE